jgi:hypothetical protein
MGRQYQEGVVAAEYEDGGDSLGTGISGGEPLKSSGPDAGCRAIEEGEEEEEEEDVCALVQWLYS